MLELSFLALLFEGDVTALFDGISEDFGELLVSSVVEGEALDTCCIPLPVLVLGLVQSQDIGLEVFNELLKIMLGVFLGDVDQEVLELLLHKVIFDLVLEVLVC